MPCQLCLKSQTVQESSMNQQEPNTADTIIPNLYLGDKNAATDLELVSKLELTHILSVDMIPLPQVVSSTFPNIALMHISVVDMCHEDLLCHFESAYKFIKEGVTRGAILVHCYHGVSRSATLVLAYLMRNRKWPLSEALSHVKGHRPCICPNDGFMDQLRLFEVMRCKLDKSFLPYKLYKLTQIHQQVKQAKILPAQVKKSLQNSSTNSKTSPEAPSLSSTPNSDVSSGGGTNTSSPNGNKGLPSRQTQYKCKKCRFTLAGSNNVLPHWSEKEITWSKLMNKMLESESVEETRNIVRSSHSSSKHDDCKNGIFLEPLQWMEVCNSVSESRLFCAKCGSKLGTYSWDAAIKCPCGASMAPGFFINLNRVDKCTMHKDIEAVI